MKPIEDHAEGSISTFADSVKISGSPRDKTVMFYEEIDSESALHINKTLLSVDSELYSEYNSLLVSEGTHLKRPTIKLRIHSKGGDVFSTLAIIDVIRQLQCDIHTYVDGSAASGAALIALYGSKRYIGRGSFMLLHQLSGSQSGKYEDMQDELENSKKIMSLIKSIVSDKCLMSSEKIDEILKHEWWLSSEECLELGLVDVVI